MNEDTKQCAIICGSIAAVIIAIAVATCYYNTAVDRAAIAAGLVQEEHGRWVAKPQVRP